jgi:hypothetical protein
LAAIPIKTYSAAANLELCELLLSGELASDALSPGGLLDLHSCKAGKDSDQLAVQNRIHASGSNSLLAVAKGTGSEQSKQDISGANTALPRAVGVAKRS